MTADKGLSEQQASRLEEILSGKAKAPKLKAGFVSEGREEPIESIELQQCDWCGTFGQADSPLESAGNKERWLLCQDCKAKAWECPICEEIKEEPENDYICEDCR